MTVHTTDEQGRVVVPLDLSVEGELWLMSAHPEARSEGVELSRSALATEVEIELVRFVDVDNTDYPFRDPGEPKRNGTAALCAHCHLRINEGWFDSEHRSSAINPKLHDLYLGTASSLDEAACAAAGGVFNAGGVTGAGCAFDDGVLHQLNDDCAPGDPCDEPQAVGHCADCHAPGMDGDLGGRDLRDATGFGRDYGVHCEACHLVESVSLDASRPGVGGKLRIVRPSEPGLTPVLGDYRPLSFGPFDDVPIRVMGGVKREHFTNGELCAGCHQYDQPALSDALTPDAARWPSGALPVHSTFEEWRASPYADVAPCQSCHMPPLTDVLNSADLQIDSAAAGSIAAAWPRPPGAVRSHAFLGPRTDDGPLLGLALFASVATVQTGDNLHVEVTVTNVGAGHAVPTGEPGRAVFVAVDARCAEARLLPVGGDAIDDLGGALDRQDSGSDWDVWPGAEVGDVIRVVAFTGSFVDYDGPGPFAREGGRFSPAERGVAEVHVVGEAAITAIGAADEPVSFDAELPVGDRAYRVRPSSLPSSDGAPIAWAGAPGVAFGRVMAGSDGTRGVPHHLAVDVASDRRLLPFAPVTTSHEFLSTCADPVVSVVALHRAFPFALQQQRGWSDADRLMLRLEMP